MTIPSGVSTFLLDMAEEAVLPWLRNRALKLPAKTAAKVDSAAGAGVVEAIEGAAAGVATQELGKLAGEAPAI